MKAKKEIPATPLEIAQIKSEVFPYGELYTYNQTNISTNSVYTKEVCKKHLEIEKAKNIISFENEIFAAKDNRDLFLKIVNEQFQWFANPNAYDFWLKETEKIVRIKLKDAKLFAIYKEWQNAKEMEFSEKISFNNSNNWLIKKLNDLNNDTDKLSFLNNEIERTVKFRDNIINSVREISPKRKGELNAATKYLEMINHKIELIAFSEKNKITMELIGLVGGYNKADTKQPVYYYINDVLKKHNLSPLEAKQTVMQMSGSVSPEWNKNVIPFIVKYLREIEPPQVERNQSKALIDNTIKQSPYPKIFIDNRGFQIFEAYRNEFINKQTDYAHYSYLFGMLKKDEFIHEMKHKKFIDFLADNFEAKELAIKYKQFKSYEYYETKEKKKAYLRYKKQFQ
jgi:hypothetical protein